MPPKETDPRLRRHRRVRARVTGTASRPRLNVFRSLLHIYAQVIDDEAGRTLASASTVGVEVGKQLEGKSKSEAAKLGGQFVAQRAKSVGIEKVVFDRGGYQYHGRVKAVADGA